MKPLERVLTPTRNRRLNEVIGMVLLVAASLLFLALASYHPTDPSFNTLGGQAHNWTGLVGAFLSDLLLQMEGVSAFMVPLLLAALGWTWLRGRPAGSPAAQVVAGSRRPRRADGVVALELGAGDTIRVPPDVGPLGAGRDHRAAGRS